MAFIPEYILILFFLIGIDYLAGLWIERSEGRRKLTVLVMSIAANLGLLFFFKYFDFVNNNLAHLAMLLHVAYAVPSLHYLLPIGLSFHTFQSLAYTIEVYRGRFAAEKRLHLFALYVMFYPQLVAGPIERPQHLLHQFVEEHRFDYHRVVSGLKLMLWGFFQKVVVADRAAVFADAVYHDPHHFAGLGLVVGTVFFAIQIYGDFAGYSNIAIGAARVMGFDLMHNFKRPYFAHSVAEFWQRWHISLSTWFRDYVYIPLGGNRVSHNRWYLNIGITFLISGLWHGAAWTFVIWGALNGVYLIITNVADERWKRLGLLQIPMTFALTSFAWIFFRAKSLADAGYIVGHLFAGYGGMLTNLHGFIKTNVLLEQAQNAFIIAGAAGIALFVFEALNARYGLVRAIERWPAWARMTAYSAFVWCIIIAGMFGNRQFIYFQF
jgi:D-alanyl-lipoteichoic acid acyltransferase DltB (MBOAT superfamily)